MRRHIYIGVTLVVILLMQVVSCKKTYFHISEEVHNNQPIRFTTKQAFYQMGKAIALTGGGFELIPGDSIVLTIVGQGKAPGDTEGSVVRLDFAETARIYAGLPVNIRPGVYKTENRAICEITGSLAYGIGENLFVCQSGEVRVDSLTDTKIYGTIFGEYLNTSNKKLTIDGPFQAGLK
jgi:hypothetical protein